MPYTFLWFSVRQGRLSFADDSFVNCGRAWGVIGGGRWISMGSPAASRLGDVLHRAFLKPFWKPTKSKAVEVGERIADFSRGFLEQNTRTEPEFVALGQSLRGLHRVAAELTGLIRQGGQGLRGALVQSRLAGEDGLALLSLNELHATLEQTSALLQSLQQTGTALEQLERQVHGIKRISIFVNASVLSFAVESVRTPECQEAFGAFVKELRALAVRIGEIGVSIGDEIAKTRLAQARGIAFVASGLEELRALAEELSGPSRKTAEEAEVLLSGSRDALAEVEECASRIEKHTSEAVYHLQFGDIVRQKTEHVIAALEEAANLLREGGSGEKEKVRCADADRILALQIHQLELVREEITQAHAQLAASFAAIGQETARLAQVLQETIAKTEGESRPLENLSADALKVEELRGRGAGLGQRASQTAEEAVEASARLAEHLDQVKSINRDMHLQALNAIVKTVALGRKGETLAVLSAEVDRLFRDSSREVEQIIVTLEGILVHARESTGGRHGADASANASETDALRARLQNISQAYEEFRTTADQARSLAERQEASLAVNGNHLGFLTSLAELMTGELATLESLRERLGHVYEPTDAIHSEMGVRLDQRYTMQSERDIHARLFGTPEATPEPQTSPVKREESSKVASVRPRHETAYAATSASLETGVATVLAALPGGDSAQAPAPVSEAPKASDPALGDNVELF